LNYLGQDNGTVVSSSFSERALYTPLAFDILDKDSAVVAISQKSDFSFKSDYSLSVVSASHAESVIYANGLLKRLFSSVEFFITVDTEGSIIVNPTSWKNVENISVDPANISKSGGRQGNSSLTPFIISFLVKYRKHPPVLDTTVNVSNISTVVISSLELAQSNLITTGWPGGGNGAPFWYSSAYPCGLDGFVIKVIAYSWYIEGESTLTNPWHLDLFRTTLNGARISANAFCNTDDILDFGPNSDLTQERKKQLLPDRISISARMSFSKYKSIDIGSVTRGDVNNKIVLANLSEDTDKIVSIASDENGFNIVLFKTGNLLYVYEESADVVYNPVTPGRTCNCLYYDPLNGQYIIGNSSGIAYISSSMISGMEGVLADVSTWKWKLPVWTNNTFTNDEQKNVKSICSLTASKYIFITDNSFTIKNTGTTLNSSVYILPTLGATGTFSKTPISSTTKPEITIKLNSITRVNDTHAIAVGTYGVILYITSSKNSNDSIAYRVDDERRTEVGTPLYNYADIKNLTDVKVYKEKYVYVCGYDQFDTACILSAPIPTENPENAKNWIWTGSMLQAKIREVSLTGSLNSIFLYEDEFLSVGSSSISDLNVVYSPERIGDNINFNFTGSKDIIYISSGWLGDRSYLLGGSRNNTPILDIYTNTFPG